MSMRAIQYPKETPAPGDWRPVVYRWRFTFVGPETPGAFDDHVKAAAQWCETQFGLPRPYADRWYGLVGLNDFGFSREDDAFAFKVRWG